MTMTDFAKWRHDDLARDLAGHLVRRTGRRAFLDMQLGPAGSPRPDVFTICHSYQNPEPISYECKVSRSDLMRDTASGKWTKYLKFSTGVVFAIPKGLASKDEIPRTAGLIVRSEKAWRMARRPIFDPVKMPQFALFKIAFDSSRAEFGRVPVPRDASTWRIAERVRKKLGDEIADMIVGTEAARKRVEGLELVAKTMRENEARAREISRAQEAARRERDREGVSRAQRDLSLILGLGGSAGMHEIRAAMNELRRRISENAEVRHLRGLIDSINQRIAEAAPIGETEEGKNAGYDLRADGPDG